VLEIGIAERAIEGEYRSGDRAVLVAYRGGALAAAIDGLGHGGDAADAAAAAAEVLSAHPDDDAVHLIEACHQALQRTRGAVMTLAWFDLERGELAWTGVGNVEARLVRGAGGADNRYASPVVLGGVVGYNLPQVRMATIPLEDGDAVALATDGVSADYSASLEPGLSAQELADRVLARHGKGTDDALAVVVRYLGDRPGRP